MSEIQRMYWTFQDLCDEFKGIPQSRISYYIKECGYDKVRGKRYTKDEVETIRAVVKLVNLGFRVKAAYYYSNRANEVEQLLSA